MSYKSGSYTTEEKIKLAGEDSKDRLYERKQNQKAIRILTVAAYVLCVSLAAIMLSLYYVFIWDPSSKANLQQPRIPNCDKIIIPDNIAIRLENSSEISADVFFRNFFKRHHLLQEQQQRELQRKNNKINENNMKIFELKEIITKPLLAMMRQGVTEPKENTLMQEKFNKNTLVRRNQNTGDAEEEEDDGENSDYEPSGQNELYTINSNDTTIIFDQDNNSSNN